ncbi:hypothetical protein DB30_06242 [Enhygromyxa salina]|uniref:Uncharacterized protein n=1 Tax=Enhygromyxa salina TaxID=215803 RepID=A0A0C2CYZ9_9BACT|nr:hypothetical protein DB30_06242 [Enhygromyxa salina]
MWSIEADAPTRVIIERVEPRSPRYAAVEVEQELLEWIANDGAMDQMPTLIGPADDLSRRLALHAALAGELSRLGGGERRFERAIEAWRMLAAINQIDRARPDVRPYYVRDRARDRPIGLDDTKPVRLAVKNSNDYRLADQPRSWTIDRKGPGQLRISARAWAPAGSTLQAAELRVHAGGRVIERLLLSDRAAMYSVDPDTALPQLEPLLTEAGDPVGEFADLTVVLAPGRRDYQIELVGGPALISIEGARRTEASLLSLRGWTPGKRAKAATRGLAKTSAPGHEWLEVLLSRETLTPLPIVSNDPRLDALAQRSPLLAVAILAQAASDSRLDERAMDHLVERVRPWLAALARDPSVAPEVRGQLRTQWLVLAATLGRREHSRLLVEQVAGGADPIGELPVEGLRVLAELLEPTRALVRSPALALLELARTRAPADDDLRAQTLRLWSLASTWSRRRPVSRHSSSALPMFAPVGEWLVAREGPLVDPAEHADSWLRLDIGRSARVRAELGPQTIRRELDDPSDDETPTPETRRLRLLAVHIATPLGELEPALLQVDGQRWYSPQLAGVQRHQVAVTEGEHEIRVDGPPGTVAWVDAPPADVSALDPSEVGRRERMWPLASSSWYLPGPAVPGVVRLELRWPQNIPPRPVWITMHQVGEFEPGTEPPSKTVLFDPRTPAAAGATQELDPGVHVMDIDLEALPIRKSPWASPRHDINLTIAGPTEQLMFDVEDGLEIAASLSLRRGLRPSDLGAGAGGDAELDPTLVEVFDGLTALDGVSMLEELRQLSRLLLVVPSDLDRRARRAALLLMLGETGNARADLLRLAAWSDRADLLLRQRERADALLGELERRFDALIEPREIVVTDLSRPLDPMLTEPALAAHIGAERAQLEPWLGVWGKLREGTNDDALAIVEAELARLQLEREASPASTELDASLLLAELTRAHLLSADVGREREAGRAWVELYGRMQGDPGHIREPIAVGLAAVGPLLTHLDEPGSDARDAGLAFGLSRELEPGYGHTSVRRLAFIAALRSDWSTLDHSEDNAGFERLELPVSELEPGPSAQVREALLVAPWSSGESEQLMPGRKGVLAWDATPGRVTAEFWCRVARPDLAPGRGVGADDPNAFGRAHVTLRLRAKGRAPVDIRQEVEVQDAKILTVELPVGRRARHQLEVVLGDDPIWLCSWRTRTAPSNASDDPAQLQVVEAYRRARWWTAESGKPVEFIVLGPASLHVETRALTTADPDKQAQELIASIEALGDAAPAGGPERGLLPLDGERERAVITETRRHFEVAHASGHIVLLTEALPYRVRLSSDQGRALIRARVRRDRPDIPPPAQVSIRELDPRVSPYVDTFDWRSVGLASPVLARDEIEPIRNRIGSLDARVRVGLDDIGNVDDFVPQFGLHAQIGWRRELVENLLWMRVAAQTAVRVQSPVAAGGIIGLGARLPVIGARLGAELDVMAHSFLGRAEASVRLYGFVDRLFWLGRYVQLRPGLSVGLRYQTLNRARVASAPGVLEPHPRVYQRYLEDHPIQLRPELELRGYPFQDLAVFGVASLMPNLNGDPVPLDHVNVEVGLTGIGRRPRPWVPTWGLSYQLSSRFADRDRSLTTLRHRVDAELGLGVWARDTARVAFGLRNQLYLSNGPSPVRDIIELWIRVDAVFGRRLRDYGPGELWFGEPWAPRGWGDDEHQARSTQAQGRALARPR